MINYVTEYWNCVVQTLLLFRCNFFKRRSILIKINQKIMKINNNLMFEQLNWTKSALRWTKSICYTSIIILLFCCKNYDYSFDCSQGEADFFCKTWTQCVDGYICSICKLLLGVDYVYLCVPTTSIIHMGYTGRKQPNHKHTQYET